MSSLFFTLMERASWMLIMVYITFRFQVTRRILRISPSMKRSLWIGMLGGVLGIVGTYLGIRYKGAIVNYRDTGVIVSALLGGMPAGVVSALIAASQRLFLGGVSAVPCALGTLTAGIGAGVFSHFYKHKMFTVPFAVFYTAVAEVVHLSYVFFMIHPYGLAVDICKTVMVPMVFTNTFSVAVLVAIFSETERNFEDLTATTTSAIFKIVENTMGIIESGLVNNAQCLAQEIKKHTDFDAVAITDRERVLSHIGAGEDHHLPNVPIMTSATRDAIQSGKEKIIQRKKLIGCSEKECPLKSAIVVPIKLIDGVVIGTVKFYRTREYEITPSDIELARGLAQIISIEANLARALKESKSVYETRYRALLSRFKPHFLFNALNAIHFLIKNDPEKARTMVYELSELLRYTVRQENTFVMLSEEVEFAKHYLEFMKYRYEDEFEYEVINNVLREVRVPSFILQPVLENSIKHAKIPSKTLKIKLKCFEKKGGLVVLEVKDNGRGSNTSASEGLGIKLIQERLENLFGERAKVSWKSSKGKGFETKIVIPVLEERKDEN